MTDQVESRTERVVIAKVCRCGHWKSDHAPECGFGWYSEPEESAACPCEAFEYAADLVR